MQQVNLPNFLIVGAMKAGTTSMYEILRQHSQIAMSSIKEVHFFDIEDNYKLGLPFYQTFFKKSNNTLAVGEATPIYIFMPEVPSRIIKLLGDQTKIIILLRNPADRAISHYKMNVQRRIAQDPLLVSLKKNLRRINNNQPSGQEENFIERGLYYSQLKRYFDLFPAENIKVILFEKEFLKQRRKTINDLFDFLNVPRENVSVNVQLMQTTVPIVNGLDKILNTAHPINQFAKKIIPSKHVRNAIKQISNKLNNKKVTKIDNADEIKKWLIKDVFYEDIKKTEELLDLDLSDWYKSAVSI